MLPLIMLIDSDKSYTPLFWTNRYASLHGAAHKILPIELSESSFALFTYSNLDFLRSPGRATFGGFWPNETARRIDLDYALTAYKHFFKKFPECNEAKIILPPKSFFPNIYESQLTALMKFNVNQKIVDTNYFVEVQNWSRGNINKGNRKKIRRFIELGGTVSYSSLDMIKKCYDVLVENRERRGVTLTMKYDDFENSLVSCRDDFKLIQASLDNQIVAACYLVKILPDYWYVLFWGEAVNFRSMSPVASLFQFIIEDAQKNRVRVLDLGISSVEGVLDEGLARFKSNLGAIFSEKVTLNISLHQN